MSAFQAEKTMPAHYTQGVALGLDLSVLQTEHATHAGRHAIPGWVQRNKSHHGGKSKLKFIPYTVHRPTAGDSVDGYMALWSPWLASLPDRGSVAADPIRLHGVAGSTAVVLAPFRTRSTATTTNPKPPRPDPG